MTDMLIGIDIAYYDPILDWKNYSWDFAFIKAMEGMTEDMDFRQQWAAANGYTIRGAYDFFHHFNDQKQVVAKLLSILGNDRGELPPVLDLEDHDGEPKKVAPKALEWLHEAERKFGRKPIVYTSLGFATSDGVDLANYPELAEYPLWLAVYPWDKITSTWTEEKRTAHIHKIINNRELFVVPNSISPWSRIDKPSFIQWTAKCPPEFVPGYPLGGKKAVDINFFPGTIQKLYDDYNISYTPKPRGDEMKPVTMTALLRELQPSNLRNLPGTVGTNVYRTLVGPLIIKGTGQKVPKDGFQWIEVVAINDDPVSGWVALTTSYTNIVWITNPAPQPTRTITKVVTHFDDGSTFDTFPR